MLPVVSAHVSATKCDTGCTPVPASPMLSDEFDALLEMMTVPVNPAPEMLMLEILTMELPELVRMVCRLLLVPTFTLLKLRFATLEVSVPGVAAVTVSDTGIVIGGLPAPVGVTTIWPL